MLALVELHQEDADCRGGVRLSSDGKAIEEQLQNRVIEEIVELQREFYFENKGKESERRRRLRDIIERATGV
jgi:hypothetical protein